MEQQILMSSMTAIQSKMYDYECRWLLKVFSSKTDYVSYDNADAVTTPNQREPHLR